MFRLACIAITAGLLLSPDVQRASHLQVPSQNQPQIPPDQTVPVLPNFNPPASQDTPNTSAQDANANQPAPTAVSGERMREESRLLILRYVSGEFVRMASPLPGGKQGFHLKAGQPLDQDGLHQAILNAGAAIYTGDKVQITKIVFRGNQIVVDVNGGGRGHTSWRDHLQMSMGGTMPVQTSTTTSDDNAPVVQQKPGATVYLDFGRDLPDMTPDQLKQYLSGVFDFSKERSAAVQWTETLPSKVKEAIAEKRAEVGMDHDEVLAALGRPDRKVRERDSEGNDIEDWIYGKPPAPTTFVRFQGDKVSQIDQYR